MFIAVLFTVAKTWRQPKCPLTNEWIKKMWYIYNGILLSYQKNEILPFAAKWVYLEFIILHGVILTDKDKYDVAYMQNLKKKIQMNLFTSKQIHRLRELTYGYQGGGVGGIDCKFEIDMYTLLY